MIKCTFKNGKVYFNDYLPLYDWEQKCWIITICVNEEDVPKLSIQDVLLYGIGNEMTCYSDCESRITTIKELYTEPSVCKKCGRLFMISNSEAKWFKENDLAQPKRCISCRRNTENFDVFGILSPLSYIDTIRKRLMFNKNLNDEVK